MLAARERAGLGRAVDVADPQLAAVLVGLHIDGGDGESDRLAVRRQARVADGGQRADVGWLHPRAGVDHSVSARTACAADRRAIGTRNGEHDT